MKIKAVVLAEDMQVRDGVEYVSITCMEQGENPLLQMFDYGLREEERIHKGKLLGKSVELQVSTIRSLYAGRPQTIGHMTVNGQLSGSPAIK